MRVVQNTRPTRRFLAELRRGLTANQYVATYLGYFDARRFQVIEVGEPGQDQVWVTGRDGEVKEVATRQGVWRKRLLHMSDGMFQSCLLYTSDAADD